MRQHGPLSSAAGLGLHDHACLAFSDDAAFLAAGLDFLADGERLGQRLAYAGSLQRDRLRERFGDLGAAVRLADHAAATERALADGFTGLRILAEVTDLVRDRSRVAAHVHWEGAADRYMAEHPLAALCCYDRRVLPAERMGDLACAHPALVGPDRLAPFRLFAGDDGALAVAGEVDVLAADAFGRVLELVTPPEGDVVLDLAPLTFMDHHGLRVLSGHAARLRSRGLRLEIRGVPGELRAAADAMDIAL